MSSHMDLDQLHKDIVKLTEENKYFKKRLGNSGHNLSNLKCEICPSYVEKIALLSQEKDECERELFEKYEAERIKCDRITNELKTLQSKYDNQQKELIDKLKIEGSLNSQISELQSKNEELNTQIKQILEAKEGFEYLQNTVSDLSLALINKNEKDLSYKQIQLIKNLFGDAQISTINTYKEKIHTLEQEKSKTQEIAKKLLDQNREVIKPLRKYAIAAKECVDLYLFLDAANSDFSDSDTRGYMNKHATDFITEYEDSVNDTLSQISDNIKVVQSCIAELNRQSDHLEIAQYDLMLESPMSKKSSSPNKSGVKDNSLVLSTPTHNFEASDFMARLAFSSYNSNDVNEYTPITKEEESSKDDKFSLFQKLKNKEREIEELKARLGVNFKMTKKNKKKGNKSTKKGTNIKEKQEKMMQEALDELQMLVEEDEKSPFEYRESRPINKLAECETHTINEADEQDEEETIFDREGNKVFSRSLKSDKNSKKERKLMLEEFRNPSWDDDRNQNIVVVNDKDYASTGRAEKLMNDYNLSLESESVKFDEDLLNDTLKFDDNNIF